MSELLPTLRDTLVALAAADPELRRFGAARHRYELLPVLDTAAAAHLPDELRAYATQVAGGGIGPYYGLLPLADVQPIAAVPGVTAFSRALPIAHLGCGYAAVIPLDGDARDRVWIDARALGVVAPMYGSFTAYMIDWIDRLATARWPEAFVPPGRCALAAALAGYLAMHEQRLGVEPGGLAGEALAEVLAALGPGAIQIANEGPLFAPDAPVEPCVACARLLDNLGVPLSVVLQC
ncbi:MAG TPA: hypothetical protein VFQ65_26475 [Kofleriaceae bacterium]|nr:hypothetical protein [Kofleriaceae bacterium]